MSAKVLLVGINDYAPVGPGGPDLRGCVNDVRDAWDTFVNVLRIVPPVPRFIRVLTDGRATKANILAGLDWLLSPMAGLDRLVFYYSGHGSWQIDTNNDEPDHRDETICPHDYAHAGMISDDDLAKVFGKLKTGITLEVIFDSCHSGTATRDLRLGMEETTPEVTARFIEPPADYSLYWESNSHLPVNRLVSRAKQAVVVAKMNHILWAACRDDQTAAEAPVNNVPRGIFSYCFFRALRRAGLGVARRNLDATVCAAVHRMGYAQVPQLEAAAAEMGHPIFRELAEMAGAGR
ncbi:MAG TPA: peptidase C14 [Solibacterales bacterium]|nr:peptidase C14 [Bryobacterales bacterium]